MYKRQITCPAGGIGRGVEQGLEAKICLFCNFLLYLIPLLLLQTSTWLSCALVKLIVALPSFC